MLKLKYIFLCSKFFIFKLKFVFINVIVAYLGKGKNAVIIKLAYELEIVSDDSETVLQIKNLITSNDEYDESYSKSLF